MAQLLVRDIDETLVHKLKRRAVEHGVSAEEEHRRILIEALARKEDGKPNLIAFLLSEEGEASADVELDLERSRDGEERDPGF